MTDTPIAEVEATPDGARLHIPIPLRWGDLDAFNHVNNTSMLKLLEESRVRAFWLPDPGETAPPTAVLESSLHSGVLTLIARQEIEYLAPVPYQRHPLDVQMWFGKLGGSSIEVCYEVCSPRETAGEHGPPDGLRAGDDRRGEGGCGDGEAAAALRRRARRLEPLSRRPDRRTRTAPELTRAEQRPPRSLRNAHHDLLRDAGDQHPVSRVDLPGRETRAPLARSATSGRRAASRRCVRDDATTWRDRGSRPSARDASRRCRARAGSTPGS